MALLATNRRLIHFLLAAIASDSRLNPNSLFDPTHSTRKLIESRDPITRTQHDQTKTIEYQNTWARKSHHIQSNEQLLNLAVNESFGFQAGSSMSPTCLETPPAGHTASPGFREGSSQCGCPPSDAGRREPASVFNPTRILQRCLRIPNRRRVGRPSASEPTRDRRPSLRLLTAAASQSVGLTDHQRPIALMIASRSSATRIGRFADPPTAPGDCSPSHC